MGACHTIFDLYFFHDSNPSRPHPPCGVHPTTESDSAVCNSKLPSTHFDRSFTNAISL